MTELRQLRARRFVFALYAALSVAYLIWRATCTLNPDALRYSIIFYALEIYATLCSLVFYAVILERRPRLAPAALPGYRVDVFICTYNESLEMVRQTIRRALAMEYPHRTWLLDDGNRPAARELANALGCHYLARENNEHYKAGNLNHALAHTCGDLVLVLDADHLVRREFLTRLIGYFEDPQVALVQTPQVFYNPDSFQHHFRPDDNQMWHEGAIFHHAMQPGADRWNAAFFVGTGALLRRSALETVHGFATESVTEDAHTCMRLHAAGYRSVYHDEPLAYLLAPESLLQYLTQRLRWGQGSMQILRRDNPLTRPGLSWRQRLVYFMALSSFAQAIVHLAYYIAPALFLVGGPAPLHVRHAVGFIPLIGHVLFDLFAFKFFLGPLARPLLAECYKFLNFYTFLKSLSGYFRTRRLRFRVTPKGRDVGASLRLLAPQLVLMLLNLAGVGSGVIRLSAEPWSGVESLGTGVATAFAGLFVLVGGMALLYAWARLGSQRDYTFPDNIPAQLRAGRGRRFGGTVVRVSESELYLLHAGLLPLAKGDPVTARLELGTHAIAIGGVVREVTLSTESRTIVHLALDPLSVTEKDALFDRFAESAMPHFIDRFVKAWSAEGGARSRPETGSFYLTLERSVL